MASSVSISASSDRLRISEEHFSRLAGVARSTRLAWAKDGLIARQSSPYSLDQLREVVAVNALRAALGGTRDACVSWQQLRDGFDAACSSGTLELVVDMYSLQSSWVTEDSVIVATVRSGHQIRLIDLTSSINEADLGFRLAARF
jgi:hypothetical protein